MFPLHFMLNKITYYNYSSRNARVATICNQWKVLMTVICYHFWNDRLVDNEVSNVEIKEIPNADRDAQITAIYQRFQMKFISI